MGGAGREMGRVQQAPAGVGCQHWSLKSLPTPRVGSSRPRLQLTGPDAAPWGWPRGWAWAAPLPSAATGSRCVIMLPVGLGWLLRQRRQRQCRHQPSTILRCAAHPVLSLAAFSECCRCCCLPCRQAIQRNTRWPTKCRRGCRHLTSRQLPAAVCSAWQVAPFNHCRPPQLCCCCFHPPHQPVRHNLPSYFCRCLIASVLFGGAMGYRAGSNP
jgi:hypothetical protein